MYSAHSKTLVLRGYLKVGLYHIKAQNDSKPSLEVPRDVKKIVKKFLKIFVKKFVEKFVKKFVKTFAKKFATPQRTKDSSISVQANLGS
jgi:hypothetical protein